MANETTAKPGEGTTGAPAAGPTGGTDQGKPAEKPASAGAPATGQEAKPAEQKPDQKPAEGDKGKPGSFLDGATKGADSKPDAGKAAADYELKIPEGVKDIDKPLFEGFGTYAKKAGLSAEQAQGAIDFYVKQVAEQEKGLVAAWEQRQAENRKALEAHPKLGGANLEKSQQTALIGIKALDQKADGLGTKATKVLMEAGLADHPVLAELFVLLGSMASEDRSGPGAKPAGGGEPTTAEDKARVMFPATFAAIDQEQKAHR